MAKIWVADDDLFYRNLISEALKEQNHDVFTMHNGSTLVELLTEEEPDLLILDVFMAQRDGVELLMDIHRMSKKGLIGKIPVIVISGDDSESTEIAVRKAHPNAFLLKPFSKGEIAQVVGAVLGADVRPGSAQQSSNFS